MTKPPSALERARRTFLEYCAVERGLSPRTIEAYGRDLQRFVERAERAGVLRPADLAREHLSSWLQGLEREGLSARSRTRALVAARRFVRHLTAVGELRRDVLVGVTAPRQSQPLPRTLRSDETEALLAAADGAGVLGLRDRAMLECLYGAGLRVSELCALPLGGLDRRRGLLRVVGKGRRERLVPLGAPALEALDAYFERARPAHMNLAERGLSRTPVASKTDFASIVPIPSGDVKSKLLQPPSSAALFQPVIVVSVAILIPASSAISRYLRA